ncbi:MAG TPA: ABC transporter permease, partial [Verrucomicrobiae bacterium]|nr:ABC transporter permease [Verrucomicrobiae bacterium]
MADIPNDLLQLGEESRIEAPVRRVKAARPSLVVTAYRDLMQQAVSAMRHDLRRTLLTMAGMAWGIATVVLLLAYGNGFGQAITNIFESFGATAVGVFPGRTSMQAGGN